MIDSHHNLIQFTLTAAVLCRNHSRCTSKEARLTDTLKVTPKYQKYNRDGKKMDGVPVELKERQYNVDHDVMQAPEVSSIHLPER